MCSYQTFLLFPLLRQCICNLVQICRAIYMKFYILCYIQMNVLNVWETTYTCILRSWPSKLFMIDLHVIMLKRTLKKSPQNSEILKILSWQTPIHPSRSLNYYSYFTMFSTGMNY